MAGFEGTGGGQTLPSYRIPILWESLFLQIRNIFYLKDIADAPTGAGRTGRSRKKGVANVTATVGGL